MLFKNLIRVLILGSSVLVPQVTLAQHVTLYDIGNQVWRSWPASGEWIVTDPEEIAKFERDFQKMQAVKRSLNISTQEDTAQNYHPTPPQAHPLSALDQLLNEASSQNAPIEPTTNYTPTSDCYQAKKDARSARINNNYLSDSVDDAAASGDFQSFLRASRAWSTDSQTTYDVGGVAKAACGY